MIRSRQRVGTERPVWHAKIHLLPFVTHGSFFVIHRYLDLLTHYQVKRWLGGKETLAGSLIMSEVESGDGAVQTINRVSRSY